MSTERQDRFLRARLFRRTASDLQTMMNELVKGAGVSDSSKEKLGAYAISVPVLRALAAECLLKALAVARSGDFKCEHDLAFLYGALDDKARTFIEETANRHGVASPRGVLNRHKDDFVAWRYPAGKDQHTEPLDLDRTLDVLDAVYRRIASGNGPQAETPVGFAGAA